MNESVHPVKAVHKIPLVHHTIRPCEPKEPLVLSTKSILALCIIFFLSNPVFGQVLLPEGVEIIAESGSFSSERKARSLLKMLRSRPTQGIDNPTVFVQVKADYAKCSKTAREVYFLEIACEMKQVMPQVAMRDACTRGEKARQALSLTLNVEVAHVEEPADFEGAGMQANPSEMERAFQKMVQPPGSCRNQAALDSKDTSSLATFLLGTAAMTQANP